MKWLNGSSLAAVLAAALLVAAGCGPNSGGGEKTEGGAKEGGAAADPGPKEKKIEAARAKLPAEDRALADAQDYCPVMPKQRLGSMGVPVKVVIKGEPVFLCCKGCKGTAEDDPDEVLKAARELKAEGKSK